MAAFSASQKSRGGARQRVENRLKIERRAADELQDVRGRGLLLQRFVQIPGARFDLGFQRSVALFDPLRHLVEAVGERLDLVAGANVEPLGEIAGPEPFRALLQTADRHHHAAREQAADGQGEQEAEAEQSERLKQRLS